MQRTVTINREGFAEFAKFIYDTGEPKVSERYSDLEKHIRRFGSAPELIADLERVNAINEKYPSYVLHYPDCKGLVEEERIALKPESCNGYKWRYTMNGWGLIQVLLYLDSPPTIKCNVGVNSQKRAEAWAPFAPKLGPTDLWDWRMVERHVRQIIRRMNKISEKCR
ncbi:MAG: hypothetical protein K1X53_06585 [Candidatus Sumerlaeaceae bacterium]|nr:hypothetical protein [Candidatus Sumerlaeaceae bacterium]